MDNRFAFQWKDRKKEEEEKAALRSQQIVLQNYSTGGDVEPSNFGDLKVLLKDAYKTDFEITLQRGRWIFLSSDAKNVWFKICYLKKGYAILVGTCRNGMFLFNPKTDMPPDAIIEIGRNVGNICLADIAWPLGVFAKEGRKKLTRAEALEAVLPGEGEKELFCIEGPWADFSYRLAVTKGQVEKYKAVCKIFASDDEIFSASDWEPTKEKIAEFICACINASLNMAEVEVMRRNHLLGC